MHDPGRSIPSNLENMVRIFACMCHVKEFAILLLAYELREIGH